MDPGLVVFLIYMVIGAIFGVRYSLRRHGVAPRNIETGLIGTSIIGAICPVAILIPALRFPQPCACRHHVLARQQQRLEEERYHEALRQEQGEG